jgi:hypothetical protein
MGADGFGFTEAEEVADELSRFTRSIEVGGQPRRSSWKPTSIEEWNPKYRGAIIADRIEDLARFIKKLPERDMLPSELSLEELAKYVEKERKRKLEEAI